MRRLEGCTTWDFGKAQYHGCLGSYICLSIQFAFSHDREVPELPDSLQVTTEPVLAAKKVSSHLAPLDSRSGMVGHQFSSSFGFSQDTKFPPVSPEVSRSKGYPFVSTSLGDKGYV